MPVKNKVLHRNKVVAEVLVEVSGSVAKCNIFAVSLAD
jgi:hypothetical protein